jgi:hypothetical protein
MEIKHRKAQTFVIAAVIFSGLLLLAVAPSGPRLTDSSNSNFKEFFEHSLSNSIGAFNEEISEEKSIDNVKRGLYSYNRFLLESSSSKGISFDSYQLAVLPNEGQAVFINYRNVNIQTNLSINGSWTNTTVNAGQSLQKDFTAGPANVTLILPDMNDEYNLTARRPRIIYWMRMSSGVESWQNSVVG